MPIPGASHGLLLLAFPCGNVNFIALCYAVATDLSTCEENGGIGQYNKSLTPVLIAQQSLNPIAVNFECKAIEADKSSFVTPK